MAFTQVALKALQDVVGTENVSDDEIVCQSYSRVNWLPSGFLQPEPASAGCDAFSPCPVFSGAYPPLQSPTAESKGKRESGQMPSPDRSDSSPEILPRFHQGSQR